MRHDVARLAVLAVLLFAARPARAQDAGVQAPAADPRAPQEVTVAAATDEPAVAPRGRQNLPENVEEAIYFRDRPDAVSDAARQYQDETLTRLLAEREALVPVRRNEAIRLLEDFIATEPEVAVEMPDALLRLSELKWEIVRSDYLRAFAAWQEVPEANRSADPPLPDYTQVIALHDRILEHHRDFDRYDFVLYMKAYALIDSGHTDDALALYQRLLTDHPTSRFVPDAHMALAEAAFTGRFDYAGALVEYEKVMEFRSSELYDIALFKSAWCMWRMGRTREAATRFREVLDLGQNTRGLSRQQRRRLRELQEEALDYLIQVFTEDESNTAANVFRFLEEIGGDRYATRVLARLSSTFFDQARYEQGVQAYQLLLEREPLNPHAFEWQQQIAAGYANLDDSEKYTAALEALATNYQPGTPWAAAQADPETIDEAVDLGERTVRQAALRTHEIAQRDRQTPKFERAAAMYRIYLDHYAEASPHEYEVRFYLAEILFHRLERFAEAGDEYLLAARVNPQGQYTRDALYNGIGAFEHVRETQIAGCRDERARGGATPPAPAPATPTPSPAPAAPPAPPAAGATPAATEAAAAPAVPESPCNESDNDRKFSETIELYVQLFPNDPDIPEILFRQGKLYYDAGIYDPAVRLWGQLLERYPQNQYAAPAGELILDSFNRAQDYGNIETWARRLKSAPAFAAPEAQSRLDGLILQAVFKTGEQLAQRGAHAEAADAYLRAAGEFPRDPRARQAYFNAGLERQRAGNLPGAVQAYDQLITLHAGSTEGALAAWTVAQSYESIAQFRDAARYYETYGERFPEGEKAQDALYNAVLLRVTAGDHTEAVADGTRFIERFPRVDAVDDVYFLVGRAHEQGQRWADAATTYREFIRRTRNADRKIEAQTRLGQVLLRGGDARGADTAWSEAVRAGRRSAATLREGLYYAAQARYLQGEQVVAEYAAIRIEGDVDGLRQRLEQKSQLLQRAAQIFADVVELRVAEWVTAALFQIGRSFELFAEALRTAPVPPGLNEEETQSYQDQISMFVVPIEERALEAFEGGYQKALELHIYNTWTAQMREALTRLNDVQYPPLRELGDLILETTPLPMPELLEGLHRDVVEEPTTVLVPGQPVTPGAEPAATPAAGQQPAGPGRRRRGGRR